MPSSFASANTRDMEARVHPRQTPSKSVARAGRFGAGTGAPGVTLSIRHPVSIVCVIARKGRTDAVSSLLHAQYGIALPTAGGSAPAEELVLHWWGANQYSAQAEDLAEARLYRELRSHLEGVASCSDQSHGRVIFSLVGPRVRDLLAKGTSVDLHPRIFGPGHCAVTQMAHVGVHLAQTGPDAFEISVARSFSCGFWEWLAGQAQELGYEIR